MVNFLSNYYKISWWTEEMKVKMQLFDGRPLSGSIPKQVTCVIKETQDHAATPRFAPQLARYSFVCSHKFLSCAWSYLCGFYMLLIAILHVWIFIIDLFPLQWSILASNIVRQNAWTNLPFGDIFHEADR